MRGPGRTPWRRRPLVALAVTLATGVVLLSTGSPDEPVAADDTQPAPAPAVASSALTLPASKFVPITPTRVLDTRPDFPPNRGFARLADNTALSFDPIDGTGVASQLSGLGISTSSVTAVVVNNTLVGAGQRGFTTMWATGYERPLAATNNAWFDGQNAPNLVIAPLGLDGKVSIYSLSDADYVVDVVGVMVESGATDDGRLQTLGPIRHSDTRSPNDHVPGQQRYGAGETRTVDLRPIGVPGSASAVVLNVTATNTSERSFITVWPADVGNPGTASVNVSTPGLPVGNQVITGVTNGRIQVFTLAATDLIIDVFGYFTGDGDAVSNDGLFVPMSPTRLLDTRDQTGPNAFTAGQPLTPNQPLRLPVADRGDIPDDGVKAGAFNLTAVSPSTRGFVTAFPSASTVPLTSSLNFAIPGGGVVVPNHALTPVASSGSIDLFSNTSTHLVVDATGFFVDGTQPLPPATQQPKTIRVSSFDPLRRNGLVEPAAAPYDFLFDRGEFSVTGSRPAPSLRVAWDACRPIRYALNVDLADSDQIELLISSIEQVETDSGLDFQYAGVTSAGFNLDNDVLLADSRGLPYKYLPPDDDGTGDVDVVIGYSNADQTSDLFGGVIGVGGSLRTGFDGSNRALAARGFAIIDIDDLADGSPLEASRLTATITHELGHMVGLGHVSNGEDRVSFPGSQGLELPGGWSSTVIRDQLMFPALTASTPTTFGAGDQLGLWELYNTVEQPCGGSLRSGDITEPLIAVEKILDTTDGHVDD